MPKLKEILIQRGKSLSLPIRWGREPIVYKAIVGITQTAPVSLDVPGHGMEDGWPCAVTNVRGMTEINAEANKVRDGDYHQATVVDADTIELNAVNAAGFRKYTGGGVLQYNTPVDLTGYEARMSIKDKEGGTELLLLSTANNKLVIDVAKKTITLVLTAAETAALLWKKGVTDLELVSPAGIVSKLKLCTGEEDTPDPVRVSGEITT